MCFVPRLHEHDKEHSEAAKLYTKYLAMVNTVGVSNRLCCTV